MPTARGGIAAAVLEGKIYVFGGEGQGTVFGEVEVYDPQQNSWRTCTPMPTPRHGLGAVAIGGRIYVIGGSWGPGGDPQSTVNAIFDP
jgi:N-acetylneuraminic acid mutarotase